MEAFRTILRKILYPKNTIEELHISFVFPQPFYSDIFSISFSKPNEITIIKNPEYKDHVFYFGNAILFNDETQNTAISKKQNIYDIVSLKYYFLKQYTDTFIEKVNSDFLELFCKIQKNYHAFARLANIWKYKRCAVQIDHDLYMNSLDKNKRNVFSLLQQNKIYLFTSANLVSIISSALSNAPNFFVEPLPIKNPYNNIHLTKSNLYNIYFFIKQSSIIMPVLFHNYFLVNFDLKKFINENENNIKHAAFDSYVRNTSSSVLYVSAITMLSKYQKNIIIHRDFPKDLLINILRPYLLLHYIIEYSSEDNRVYEAIKTIKYKLKKLYNYNPMFGRKIVKINRTGMFNKMIKKIEFCSSHPIFDEQMDIQTFQNTHIEIVEPTFRIPVLGQTQTNRNYDFVVFTHAPSLTMQNNIAITQSNGTYNDIYEEDEEDDDEAEEYEEADEEDDENNTFSDDSTYNDEEDVTIIESDIDEDADV